MEQQIKLDGLTAEEQAVVNEVMSFISGKEDYMELSEIQKWVDRCKSEVKLSAPRHDGNDVEGWADECEAWLVETTKAENVKFSTNDICTFRDMINDWVIDQYYIVA